jgi:hypothetical protein
LLAQSKSRLLKDEEKENLQSIANKLLSHANGDVVSPTVIEFSETANVETQEDKTTVEENATLVSFADVQ